MKLRRDNSLNASLVVTVTAMISNYILFVVCRTVTLSGKIYIKIWVLNDAPNIMLLCSHIFNILIRANILYAYTIQKLYRLAYGKGLRSA